MYTLAEEREDIDGSKLSGENFNGLSGQQLCDMTIQEFITRDATYGEILFSCLQNLLHDDGKSVKLEENSPLYFSGTGWYNLEMDA